MSDSALTLYADYVCPFCYLGRTSLERYRDSRDDPVAIEWHPFDLRAGQRDESGELVRDSPKDESYYEQAWRNVERLAEDYDVEMPDEPIIDVDSMLAQQTSLYVQSNHPENWEGFDAAVYDAHWHERRDIEDPDVLENLAAEVGLDPGVVSRAQGEEHRVALEKRFEAARERGITGVPTFVFDDHVARGAVGPAQLRRLVEGTD